MRIGSISSRRRSISSIIGAIFIKLGRAPTILIILIFSLDILSLYPFTTADCCWLDDRQSEFDGEGAEQTNGEGGDGRYRCLLDRVRAGHCARFGYIFGELGAVGL